MALRTRMRGTTVGAIAAIVVWSSGASATLPSATFREVVQDSDCIFVATRLDHSGSVGTASFTPLALISGAERCRAKTVNVRPETTEGSFTGAPNTTYVLFLRRVDGELFGYAREPWSILSVRDGVVNTVYFLELPKTVPLDQLMQLIHREENPPK